MTGDAYCSEQAAELGQPETEGITTELNPDSASVDQLAQAIVNGVETYLNSRKEVTS